MLKEIAERRSVRKFLDRAVPEELLLQLLDSARMAPSGNNTQPWRFILVRDPARRAEIAAIDHRQKWMQSAPVLIVCTADLSCRLPGTEATETSPVYELKQVIRDASAAVENLLLEAVHCGLGACWTGWYDQEPMRELLGIPGNQYVLGVVPLGYPAEHPAPRPRAALDTLISYEVWGGKKP